jgi:HTH-type transcriptional regulator / antitoxin HipB
MRIGSVDDLGRHVREQRRSIGLTQQELAERAGVSRRWLSGLEAGKASAEIGLVLRVIAALGMYADVRPAPRPDIDLDDYLKTFEGPR